MCSFWNFASITYIISIYCNPFVLSRFITDSTSSTLSFARCSWLGGARCVAWCTFVQAGRDDRERVHAGGMAAESSCSKLEAGSLGSLQELGRATHWTPCAKAAILEACFWYVMIITVTSYGVVRTDATYDCISWYNRINHFNFMGNIINCRLEHGICTVSSLTQYVVWVHLWGWGGGGGGGGFF